jgi:predicted enzyme related to lactoylglutathione lyase
VIKHIAFTVYPSNDVAGTRAWYEETLGLKFAGPYMEDGVEKYNEAHLGDGAFALMASEWVGREPGSAASIAFEVDDLAAAVQSLTAKGVTVEDIFEGPVCKSTSFEDPEGNKVTIHQKNLA